MNDQDQPLGAPNLNSTAASQVEQQQPNQEQPKQKRRLNWKGFWIGIIAVIIIQFFAISMLNSPDPEIPIPPPNEPTISQSTPVLTQATTPTASPTASAPVTECRTDAMQCPDGSSVGRTGPNCEFVCPKPN